jgi:hypothetical protein
MILVKRPSPLYPKKDVLFFPSISLPDDDWTYKSLLYYDSIHVIAPESYNAENQYNELTKKLMDRGIVKTINPWDYLHSIQAYEDALIQYIEENVNFKLNAQSSFNLGKLVRIHRDKFHYNLFEHLERNSLAKEITGSSWIEMEENIALIILTFLATVISEEKELELATNNIKNIQIINRESISNFDSVNLKEHETRMNILNGIMPYAVDNNVDKILSFKRRNLSALVDFRILIESKVKSNALYPSNSNDKYLKDTVDELKWKAAKIESQLKDENFAKILFGGVCGIPVTIAPLLGEPTCLTLPTLLFGLYQLYGSVKENGSKNEFRYLAFVNEKFS